MIIKTITCHEVYNHGASLQEYALLKYLNSNEHQAETIHYKPPYLSQHFSLTQVGNPKWNSNIFFKAVYLALKLPGRIHALQRKAAFDEFAVKFIPTGTTLYKSNAELKSNLPAADAFICGSDQVWNSFFENGKDPAFYLDFVPEEKLKISYAPSFAIDEIEAGLKPFVKEKVQRIDHISVRETSGKTILANLGITNVTQVLDPVFLLPASHWKDTFVNDVNEKYVFIYDFDNNPIIQKLTKKIAKEHGLKIFTVNQNLKYADANYWKSGPEKFLSLMYHATFVITNSFHSVAFSLIFEKQFTVVNRNEKINTRMRDLLGIFGLSSLLISSEDEISGINLIDYATIEAEKNIAIKRSKDFLQTALNQAI